MSAPLFLLVDHMLSLCCSLVNADPLTAAVNSGKFSAHASSADRALSYSLNATFLVIIGLLTPVTVLSLVSNVRMKAD